MRQIALRGSKARIPSAEDATAGKTRAVGGNHVCKDTITETNSDAAIMRSDEERQLLAHLASYTVLEPMTTVSTSLHSSVQHWFPAYGYDVT